MTEKLTLARPYAKAAFSYAVEHSCLDEWSVLLANLSEVSKSKQVIKIIKDPKYTDKTLAELFGSFINKDSNNYKKLCNFISVVAVYDRLELFPEISELFNELKAKHEQVAKITVTSAVDLDSNQQELIKDTLTKKNNTKVEVSFAVQSELIGGLVVKMGDLVIDASVQHMLSKLQSKLAA